MRDCRICGEPVPAPPDTPWHAARCSRCTLAKPAVPAAPCECHGDFCICGGRGRAAGRGDGGGRTGGHAGRGTA
eukprot:2547180-Prymnesium_polylepis.1